VQPTIHHEGLRATFTGSTSGPDGHSQSHAVHAGPIHLGSIIQHATGWASFGPDGDPIGFHMEVEAALHAFLPIRNRLEAVAVQL
jgi:hypothetical protein